MSSKQVFFRRDYDVIKQHNDKLIASAKIQIGELRSIPRAERDKYRTGLLDYWVSVVQALSWSTEVARQQARVPANGRSVS